MIDRGAFYARTSAGTSVKALCRPTGLLGQYIYHANEIILAANGLRHDQWVSREYISHLIHHARRRSSLLTKIKRIGAFVTTDWAPHHRNSEYADTAVEYF